MLAIPAETSANRFLHHRFLLRVRSAMATTENGIALERNYTQQDALHQAGHRM